MRLVILSLALAIAASAPLAAEVQTPVQAPPLRAGEVLLEVNALGTIETRADRATLTFSLTGNGETEAEARVAANASIGEVRAALRALGVADADMTIGEVAESASTAMTVNTMDTMDTADNAAAAAEAMTDTNMAMSSASAAAQAQVVIRNVDRVPAVQAALMERGIYGATPTYALADESGARRQARTQALAKARADAEAYAAALNMRVVRVVRVTERLGLEIMTLIASEFQTLGRLFGPNLARSGPQVQTLVVTGIDFALAPR